jgi:hypothetical protein
MTGLGAADHSRQNPRGLLGRYSPAKGAYQTFRQTAKLKPYPNTESFKTIFKDVSDRIPAAKTANPKDFMDTSFLKELDKSGYIDGLYR